MGIGLSGRRALQYRRKRRCEYTNAAVPDARCIVASYRHKITPISRAFPTLAAGSWYTDHMDNSPPPSANSLPYFAIIGTSALLCFAWLLTGSLMLTLIIIVLVLLHLARHFPDAEQIVSADPILLWLRRFSPLIVIAIAGIILAVRYL